MCVLIQLFSSRFEPKVRVDSGLLEGMEISTHYDPMIAKLVAHGPTREACINRMEAALEE